MQVPSLGRDPPEEGIDTPVFPPGEFQGQRSLAGHSPWDRKESDTTEVTSQTHKGSPGLFDFLDFLLWSDSPGQHGFRDTALLLHSHTLSLTVLGCHDISYCTLMASVTK